MQDVTFEAFVCCVNSCATNGFPNMILSLRALPPHFSSVIIRYIFRFQVPIPPWMPLNICI